MNRWLGMLAALFVVAALGTAVEAQNATKPAIVYSTGGKADKSFNESASKGVNRFKGANQTVVAEFEPTDEKQFEQALRDFAQRGQDPVVAIGFSQAAAIEKVAKEFPNVRFTIVDGTVTLPNVRSITFKEQESSFLVGMAAALVSKSGKVGFIGGMDSPLMRRFQCGYEQGVKYANPKVELIANMTGTTAAAWNDPERGAALAKAQFDRGVDVVYAAAGSTGVGVLQAAKDRGKYAIGSQNKKFADPATILTSTVKRVDIATFQAFAMAQQGTWRYGLSMLGLKEGAVDWSLEEYNEKAITPDIKAKIEAAKAAIVAGKLAVHDYMSNNSCKR